MQANIRQCFIEILHDEMLDDRSVGVRKAAAVALIRLGWEPSNEMDEAGLYLARGYWPATVTPGHSTLRLLSEGLRIIWSLPIDASEWLQVACSLAIVPEYQDEVIDIVTSFLNRLHRSRHHHLRFAYAIDQTQQALTRLLDQRHMNPAPVTRLVASEAVPLPLPATQTPVFAGQDLYQFSIDRNHGLNYEQKVIRL